MASGEKRRIISRITAATSSDYQAAVSAMSGPGREEMVKFRKSLVKQLEESLEADLQLWDILPGSVSALLAEDFGGDG